MLKQTTTSITRLTNYLLERLKSEHKDKEVVDVKALIQEAIGGIHKKINGGCQRDDGHGPVVLDKHRLDEYTKGITGTVGEAKHSEGTENNEPSPVYVRLFYF